VPDVEKISANAAVKKYKPKVVIGSWVTQKSMGGKPGCMYGLDEFAILRQSKAYVVFGSMCNHTGRNKDINTEPHRTVQEPWMWSRAQDSALFIWGK